MRVSGTRRILAGSLRRRRPGAHLPALHPRSALHWCHLFLSIEQSLTGAQRCGYYRKRVHLDPLRSFLAHTATHLSATMFARSRCRQSGYHLPRPRPCQLLSGPPPPLPSLPLPWPGSRSGGASPLLHSPDGTPPLRRRSSNDRLSSYLAPPRAPRPYLKSPRPPNPFSLPRPPYGPGGPLLESCVGGGGAGALPSGKGGRIAHAMKSPMRNLTSLRVFSGSPSSCFSASATDVESPPRASLASFAVRAPTTTDPMSRQVYRPGPPVRFDPCILG
jgi:hypothetical protein